MASGGAAAAGLFPRRRAEPLNEVGQPHDLEGAVGRRTDVGALHRWVGKISIQGQYDALGIKTPRFYTPLILGGVVVASFLVLLVGGLAYLGVDAVAGDLPDVVWVAVLAAIVVGHRLWRKVRRR